jgi:hypothetical protein
VVPSPTECFLGVGPPFLDGCALSGLHSLRSCPSVPPVWLRDSFLMARPVPPGQEGHLLASCDCVLFWHSVLGIDHAW